MQVALRVKPDQVTLVPERPEEVTTEGGLNLILYGRRIADVAERLAAAGIAVSLFIDPDPRQIQALSGLAGGGVDRVRDQHRRLYPGRDRRGRWSASCARSPRRWSRGGRPASTLYAGHGLRTDNVGPIAAIPGMEELNIGHSIIARAVIVGMEAAVEEMLAAMALVGTEGDRRPWSSTGGIACLAAAGGGHRHARERPRSRACSRGAVERAGAGSPEPWYAVYHTLFSRDLYLHGSVEGFRPADAVQPGRARSGGDPAPSARIRRRLSSSLYLAAPARAKARATIAASDRLRPARELRTLPLGSGG